MIDIAWLTSTEGLFWVLIMSVYVADAALAWRLVKRWFERSELVARLDMWCRNRRIGRNQRELHSHDRVIRLRPDRRHHTGVSSPR